MSLNLREYAATIRVTDGAWGTQLQKFGLPPGSPPEIWNVSKPTVVQEIAEAYVKAGSDIILTNTFGANRFILADHGVQDRAAELAEAGAAISKRAAGKKALVFASIGPTGKIVMMEEVARDAFAAAFAETAEAVAFGGADGIVLESFAELEELAIAVRACRKATDLPVVASMTFASGPDQTVTMMGAKPEELAAMALREGASAVGANCGVGPANYVEVARLLREACDLPIWIKANAGVPIVTREGTKFPMGPDEFASFVPALVKAGANFIGGCCGTTPEHIRAVRKKIK
ncbi:MAG: homocysteine S-methyltransferase family protein [Phycisphaerae bacterium]